MKNVLIAFLLLSLLSCDITEGVEEEYQDGFDREAMLTHWADNIILPGYQAYLTSLTELRNGGINAFLANPNTSTLEAMRETWKDAYLAWQSVAMFEIGPAERVGLQGYTNTYPLDVEEMTSFMLSGTYNLELPSRRNQQGLPALDFLINGLGNTDEEIITVYTNENSDIDYGLFMGVFTDQLIELTEQVLNDWNSDYRAKFVVNTGSSATGAVNKMANDYVFWYEKHLRAGKIGIPAGVFSGTPSGQKVEAYYQNNFSKELYLAGLNAGIKFFNGISYDDETTGDGFKAYLEYLNSYRDGEALGALISDQFRTVLSVSQDLSMSFSDQVQLDNTRMLNTYDELQRNVILLKVDMLQSLNVRIDYVDADGD